jgi:formate hydrogenlyase subunit 3/multisubunit Na+/H+ antiporter MnhD subunit
MKKRTLQKETFKKRKGVVALEYLFWMIVAVAFLILGVFIIVQLTGKGSGALEFIKHLLTGG